jgi:PhnB protein
MTQAIPQGYTTVTPMIAADNCAEVIELYKKAFGAKENPDDRTQCPETGKIMHTIIEIGSSKIMMSDIFPNCPQSQGQSFYVYVADADKAISQAKEAGLEVTMPIADMFWGDRLGAVKDPCGIAWSIATHVKDVSREDLNKGAKEMVKQMKEGAGKKAA